MTILLFSNNALTRLAQPLTPSATSALLAPGSGSLFPDPGSGEAFMLTFSDGKDGLFSEIVLVTGRTGDIITAMTRAQEGTVALPWPAASCVENLITAGTLQSFQQTSAALPPFRVAGQLTITGPYTTPPYAEDMVIVFLGNAPQPEDAYTYITDGITGTLNLLVDPLLYENMLVTG